MLVELGVVEQRYRAVLEVLDEGASVTEVARRYGVARQTVHEWLRRYAAEVGWAGWRTGRRGRRRARIRCRRRWRRGCVAMRRAHPGWGPRRICWQLERDGVTPVPGRSSVYRALVRHGLVDAKQARAAAGGLPAVGAGPGDGAVADGRDGPGATWPTGAR